MNILVFLIIVGTVSAWYVPVEKYNTHGMNLIKRRNDGYINQKLETTLWETERASVSSSELGSLEDRVATSVWETERTSVQTTELGSLEDRKVSWVWGTEEPSVTTTKLGSLEDRAAFTANGCPTDKFKIRGICVYGD